MNTAGTAPARNRTSSPARLTSSKAVNITTGEVRQTSYTYYGNGTLWTVTDPVGGVVTYEYDLATEQISKITDQLRHSSQQKYDASGRPFMSVDVNGLTTTYHYDTWHRVMTVTKPDKQTNAISYRTNDTGTSMTVTSPTGASIRVSRDGLGRDVRDHNRQWRRWPHEQRVCDVRRRNFRVPPLRINWVDSTQSRYRRPPHSHSTSWGTQREIVDALGHDGTYGYSADPAHGTIATLVAGANGITSVTTSDAWDRTVERAQGTQKLQYGWLDQDRLSTISDNLGIEETYTYDGFGAVDTIVNGDSGRTHFTYNSDGSVHEEFTPTSRNTYAYDASGRPTGITSAHLDSPIPPSPLTDRWVIDNVSTWRYDEPGHGASIGQLTSETDSDSGVGCTTGTTRSEQYDQLARPISTTFCVDGKRRMDRHDLPDSEQPAETRSHAGWNYTHIRLRLGRATSNPGSLRQRRNV